MSENKIKIVKITGEILLKVYFIDLPYARHFAIVTFETILIEHDLQKQCLNLLLMSR